MLGLVVEPVCGAMQHMRERMARRSVDGKNRGRCNSCRADAHRQYFGFNHK